MPIVDALASLGITFYKKTNMPLHLPNLTTTTTPPAAAAAAVVVVVIHSLLGAVLTVTPLLLLSGETVQEAPSRFAMLVESDSRRKRGEQRHPAPTAAGQLVHQE